MEASFPPVFDGKDMKLIILIVVEASSAIFIGSTLNSTTSIETAALGSTSAIFSAILVIPARFELIELGLVVLEASFFAGNRRFFDF